MTGNKAIESAKPYRLEAIGTTLSRARCRRPAQIARMVRSLSQHGQLTPLVATPGARAPDGIELVDGFKRLTGAQELGWETLQVEVKPLDTRGQWATMLLLNRGPSSMTMLEEGLVLQELVATGMTQSEAAALCLRHKTWVSRRIGLVERLHPELGESMKLGLLQPGSARRLLALPQGNQVEVATAVMRARLGPQDTERLVGLWQRTRDASARRKLLSEPRASLSQHYPQAVRAPPDARLSCEGQSLSRALSRFEATALPLGRCLRAALTATDRPLLAQALSQAEQTASRLVAALGRARSATDASVSDGNNGNDGNSATG